MQAHAQRGAAVTIFRVLLVEQGHCIEPPKFCHWLWGPEALSEETGPCRQPASHAQLCPRGVCPSQQQGLWCPVSLLSLTSNSQANAQPRDRGQLRRLKAQISTLQNESLRPASEACAQPASQPGAVRREGLLGVAGGVKADTGRVPSFPSAALPYPWAPRAPLAWPQPLPQHPCLPDTRVTHTWKQQENRLQMQTAGILQFSGARDHLGGEQHR